MKKIVEFAEEVGGDGAKVGGALGVENDQLKLEISATYPLEKIIAPATEAVESLLNKLEQAIPGDWDKPMIEQVKVEFKKELIKLLSE